MVSLDIPICEQSCYYMRSLVTRIGIVFAGLMIGALQENWKIDINYILEWSAYVPNYESLSVQDRTQALKSCHPYMPYDYYFKWSCASSSS
jgi:hypothetical protein